MSQNFMYNSMLANALAQLLTCRERRIIRQWLDRLQSVTDGRQIEIRNDYMWFLLLILQKKKITLPFTSTPYSGDLIPLRDIVQPIIYDGIVNDKEEANLAWVDQVIAKGETELPRNLSTPPAQFLQNQPKPQQGVICYMGAFSDQSTK